jgi:trypsin
VVALLAIIVPSLSQAADAKPVRPGTDIIGGGPASPGEFPFMAAVLDERIGGNDWNKQFCGGSLIASDWVLTAAHCVQGANPLNLAVAVGRTQLSSSTQGVRLKVDSVHIHPDYNKPISLAHDAALLHLVGTVSTNIATPIRLAVESDDVWELAGTPLAVIGWGTTSVRKASYPDALQEVDVPVVDDGTCRTAYKTSLHAPSMVCAGAPNIDSCYGDSGGPLFARNNGSPIQIGIVSWGNGCAKKRFPGVYSEVNNTESTGIGIRNWINGLANV